MSGLLYLFASVLEFLPAISEQDSQQTKPAKAGPPGQGATCAPGRGAQMSAYKQKSTSEGSKAACVPGPGQRVLSHSFLFHYATI